MVETENYLLLKEYLMTEGILRGTGDANGNLSNE
jgi:hypothetical protein